MTFDQFVASRLAALLRYATVVSCDPHLAEDIVQEVLLRAQGRWSRLARMEQPEAYLKRMVLNQFLSWRRRRAAREVPLGGAHLEATGGSVPDPAIALGQRDELVRRIAALPPKQRAVIALRYFEDLTDSEIADLLDCREGTVRSHASRALAALRATGPGQPARPSAMPGIPTMGESR